MTVLTVDPFTEADDTLLETHNGPGAQPYWRIAPKTSGAGAKILGNRVVPFGAGTALQGTYLSPWLPDTPDYTVQADITVFSNVANSYPALIGRAIPSGSAGYSGYIVFYTTAGKWQLFKFTNGAQAGVELGSWLQTSVAAIAASPQTVQLQFIGTTINVIINGVTQISVVDASWTLAGRCGMQFKGATPTLATGVHLDNFTAFDSAAAPTNTVQPMARVATGQVDGGSNYGNTTKADAGLVGIVPTRSTGASYKATPSTGQTLVCDTGTWTGAPTSYAYQWYSGAAPIGGAATNTYTLLQADEGQSITCQVTATNATGSTMAASSVVTGATLPATTPKIVPNGQPLITGTRNIGQLLTCSQGTWSGAPTGYTYQWYRFTPGTGMVVIAGANANTHTVVAGDLAKQLVCQVTATNPTGSQAYAARA